LEMALAEQCGSYSWTAWEECDLIFIHAELMNSPVTTPVFIRSVISRKDYDRKLETWGLPMVARGIVISMEQQIFGRRGALGMGDLFVHPHRHDPKGY
jgi:hypothetical protein